MDHYSTHCEGCGQRVNAGRRAAGRREYEMEAGQYPAESDGETIAAIATAAGRGAIGVVRLSGPRAFEFAQALAGPLPPPRNASLRNLRDAHGEIIDEALLLAFPGPMSFTGEDIVEFQAHGGPAVLSQLMDRVLELGARHARPGEFSERAFLNGRLDLAQAEAIADLIAASSRRAARSAVRSLRGEFSRQIEALVERLTTIRAHLEAGFDFSDEEDVNALEEARLRTDLRHLIADLTQVLELAQQGQRLNDGFTAVLVGEPNVGKSSLLNRLADDEVAIVTPVPGTTRDLLRAQIEMEGLAVEILDTAGLRDTDDPIEREGVRRTLEAMAKADILIRVFDDCSPEAATLLPVDALSEDVPCLSLYNKVDLSGGKQGKRETGVFGVSALSGAGIDDLRSALSEALGYHPGAETQFTARARHVAALRSACEVLHQALELSISGSGSELIAEELRSAQARLGEITGRVTNEDLLGVIFSTFCIGK